MTVPILILLRAMVMFDLVEGGVKLSGEGETLLSVVGAAFLGVVGSVAFVNL